MPLLATRSDDVDRRVEASRGQQRLLLASARPGAGAEYPWRVNHECDRGDSRLRNRGAAGEGVVRSEQ